MIKVYASEMLDYVVDDGVQIHGGYGYHQDDAVERAYRDSRINLIFERHQFITVQTEAAHRAIVGFLNTQTGSTRLERGNTRCRVGLSQPFRQWRRLRVDGGCCHYAGFRRERQETLRSERRSCDHHRRLHRTGPGKLAEGLAELGAHLVLLCARKQDRCDLAAEELRALGVKAIVWACDVKDPVSVQEMVDATLSAFGRIDVLINNAGISWDAPVEEMQLEDWNKVIETNLTREVCCGRDKCNRPDSTPEGLLAMKPHFDLHSGEGTVTAGNSSQLSDGFGHTVDVARVRLSAGCALQLVFRGFQVAGCDPDEMGIGPVFAVPKLLKRTGLKMADIDLWELNEAFAVQVI